MCARCLIESTKGVHEAGWGHPSSYHAVLWTGSHAAPMQSANIPGFRMCGVRAACLSGCRWRRR